MNAASRRESGIVSGAFSVMTVISFSEISEPSHNHFLYAKGDSFRLFRYAKGASLSRTLLEVGAAGHH